VVIRLHLGGPLKRVYCLLPSTLATKNETNACKDLRIVRSAISREAELAQSELEISLAPVVVIAAGAVSLGQVCVDFMGALGSCISAR
jgi:hypothetical protein